MEVKLLTYTPNPDLVCASAAYISWKKKSAEEIIESMEKESAKEFLKKVIEWGHTSVIEHAVFTFSVKGISRACSHQLIRHRIASYTQQSQRYVKFDKIDFVLPPKIKGKLREKYLEYIKEGGKLYKELISHGVPLEDARYVFPNAVKTNIVITMNARELLLFFSLRCCNRAQWEIRELANKMLKEVKKVAPTIFENAGARCKSIGYCPEGELSCGAFPTKKDFLNMKK